MKLLTHPVEGDRYISWIENGLVVSSRILFYCGDHYGVLMTPQGGLEVVGMTPAIALGFKPAPHEAKGSCPGAYPLSLYCEDPTIGIKNTR